MKKYFLTVLVSFLFILSIVSASPVEISIEPKEQTGQLYSVMKFKMIIINDQYFDDSFQIVFSGPHLEWIMPSRIAQGVVAQSSEEIEVIFYPTGSNKGKFDFTVSVYSLKNPDVKASEDFSVNIPYDVSVKAFTASASGNTVSFNLDLQTAEEKTVKGTFSFRDSSGKTLGSLPFTETVNGEKKITRSLVLQETPLAGASTAEVEIEGTGIKEQFTFNIIPARNIVKTVQEVSSGLTKEVTVYIRNEGNVVERDYSFQQTVPMDFMTGLMTRPGENCREEADGMVCNYLVKEIRPGATANISYIVNYWPAFNGYLTLTIIVIGLVIYSFFRATSPRILKRHSRKGENTYNISIHIKNPFFHNLRDVIVRDWVSPLAQVLHEEIESTRPVMRSLEDGTELIWKLGDMKPREERILQYKVRSLVHGHLKMPRAHLKFSAGKGEKKIKLVSNGITLE